MGAIAADKICGCGAFFSFQLNLEEFEGSVVAAADQELIGLNERRATLLFNGYGEFVADLYKGLERERLWA